MRFVLGVLTGAAVVLWLSGTTGDPRRFIVEQRIGALDTVETSTVAASEAPAGSVETIDSTESIESDDMQGIAHTVARESAPGWHQEPQRQPAPERVESGERAEALAALWTPFHSERSAIGFAGRLSRALDHPFRVRRQGPGAYQVVFPFEDSSQRDALLTQVTTLTGLEPELRLERQPERQPEPKPRLQP